MLVQLSTSLENLKILHDQKLIQPSCPSARSFHIALQDSHVKS